MKTRKVIKQVNQKGYYNKKARTDFKHENQKGD